MGMNPGGRTSKISVMGMGRGDSDSCRIEMAGSGVGSGLCA